MQETWVQSLGGEDPLEEEMATYSSIHAWEIPWTEEPGGLQFMGSQRVRHSWSDLACTHGTTKNSLLWLQGSGEGCQRSVWCWHLLKYNRIWLTLQCSMPEQLKWWPEAVLSGCALEMGIAYLAGATVPQGWRIDAFELWCWRRLLRVPWTARRSNQSILKEISLNIHWKDWCWSWDSNTLANWCEELTHWKRPWCWEKLKAGGEGDDRVWDGWMVSLTQWTWVWVNSRSWQWTGRPGVLQSMEWRRVRHDWATELSTECALRSSCLAFLILHLPGIARRLHPVFKTLDVQR